MLRSLHAALLLGAVSALVVACGGSVDGTDAGSPTSSPIIDAPDGAAGAASTPLSLLGDYAYDGSATAPNLSGTLHVAADGIAFTGDCIGGTAGPVLPDAAGDFSLPGTLATLGGAILVFSNVVYAGTVVGDTIVLTVTYGDDPELTYGPIVLELGAVPTVHTTCI